MNHESIDNTKRLHTTAIMLCSSIHPIDDIKMIYPQLEYLCANEIHQQAYDLTVLM
ncbi:hypothetical protein HanIR_Chr03g0113321 [Helianthus annuus]|nr:hypothetical protein HanIR_Chr03g0113321 [Helianthus annuus]